MSAPRNHTNGQQIERNCCADNPVDVEKICASNRHVESDWNHHERHLREHRVAHVPTSQCNPTKGQRVSRQRNPDILMT